jgi:hypothetical protein
VRQHNRHLDLSTSAQHLERYIVTVPADPDIDAGLSQLQVAQDDFIEECRQAWIAQADIAATGVEFQPERRLQ